MMGHKIYFYGEKWIIIPKLSLLPLLNWTTVKCPSINMYWYISMFSCKFCKKGKLLLLLSSIMKPVQNQVYFQKKEFAPRGANYFLQEVTLIQKGGKNEHGIVASPESVPIHFKT